MRLQNLKKLVISIERCIAMWIYLVFITSRNFLITITHDRFIRLLLIAPIGHLLYAAYFIGYTERIGVEEARELKRAGRPGRGRDEEAG